MPALQRSLKATIALAVVSMFFVAVPAADAAKTVTISGKAYRFNHMDTPIPDATVKVRELPSISATTGTDGDYRLVVPNHTNVTPYIESGWIPPGTVPFDEHYNEIDLQTFHTRGADIENANFQTPTDFEYGALKAILSVPASEDGRPEQCAIVTTSSARNVRGVDYQTFWDRTPHGVAGATSFAVPAIPGPIYFNEHVIPDETKTSSSEDGGIVWAVVPTGTYRIITEHPTSRFASFLATCENGRVVNANPPWGAYELAPGEKPLGASNVAGSVVRAKGWRKGRKRFVSIRVKSGEQLDVSVSFGSAAGLAGAFESRKVPAGTRTVRLRMPRVAPRQKIPLKLKVQLKDASGVKFKVTRRVTLPPVKKKFRR
ncbi:MAG: hypothetical protein WBW44_11675 [Solirubrobacterales bacterium]